MNNNELKNFKDEVALKYSLFNGLFLKLPFQNITEIGSLLPLLAKHCKENLELHKSPEQIIDDFFQP